MGYFRIKNKYEYTQYCVNIYIYIGTWTYNNVTARYRKKKKQHKDASR